MLLFLPSFLLHNNLKVATLRELMDTVGVEEEGLDWDIGLGTSSGVQAPTEVRATALKTQHAQQSRKVTLEELLRAQDPNGTKPGTD